MYTENSRRPLRRYTPRSPSRTPGRYGQTLWLGRAIGCRCLACESGGARCRKLSDSEKTTKIPHIVAECGCGGTASCTYIRVCMYICIHVCDFSLSIFIRTSASTQEKAEVTWRKGGVVETSGPAGLVARRDLVRNRSHGQLSALPPNPSFFPYILFCQLFSAHCFPGLQGPAGLFFSLYFSPENKT